MDTKKGGRGKKKDRDHDNLLKLIEEGDPATILSEADVSKGFNELMSHGLIVLEEGKIHLTNLGKEAKKEGVKVVTKREQLKAAAVAPQAIAPLPDEALKLKWKNIWVLILVFLLILALFATINLFGL